MSSGGSSLPDKRPTREHHKLLLLSHLRLRGE
ncbi:hypothetical protein MTR67_032463 [Solanum verrucosum]|uniref:Uncharacterized protein n=1 Tax=Solanum verrucosum TaxID=315347 RepID=A0AAF0ZHZ0_SOLVR|nr:hypothetical protein MTR67_032463 [Solanum verrucosum]